MGLLTNEDKEKIKRAVPKGSNKIIYTTAAQLYIAYPDPNKYINTQLSGAIVLVNDLVGKTFFIKLIDIEGQRGVLWDQELPVNFEYHQDRTFFHSFELEEFYAGLLFEDISEAKHFFKRVNDKDKYASKETKANKSALVAKSKAILEQQSAPAQAGPRGFQLDASDPNNAQKIRRAKAVLYYNDVPPPEWRGLYKELEEREGISEWMIVDNRDFIKQYVMENGPSTLKGLEPPIPRKYQFSSAASASSGVSSSPSIKKKPPPPPPGVAASSASSASSISSATPSPPASSPAPNRFRVPPPPSVAPSNHAPPSLPQSVSSYQQARYYQQQQQPQPQPQPSMPPLPPKTPLSPPRSTPSRAAPPPPPSRSHVAPPPPPSRRSVAAPPPPPSRKLVAPPPPVKAPLDRYSMPMPLPGGNAAPPAPPPPPVSSFSAGNSAPPAPPAANSAAAPPPSLGNSVDALFASIRGSGIGKLRPVDKSQIQHY